MEFVDVRTAGLANNQHQSATYLANYNRKAAFVFGLINVILGGCAVVFQSIYIALSHDDGAYYVVPVGIWVGPMVIFALV